MKRKILTMLLVLCLLLAISACSCSHDWEEADCDDPKTCALCGETEGESLGHEWEDADCTKAKTCKECGKTKGEPLGHDWEDATCIEAKTCSVCGEKDGEALGHTWMDATTDAPKTCSTCGETEGERIITDSRFTTSATKDFYGSWQENITFSASDLGWGNYSDTFEFVTTFTFDNKGNYTMSVMPVDPVAMKDVFKAIVADSIYQQYSAYGYDKSATDAYYMSSFGMNVTQYVDEYYKDIDFEQSYAEASVNGVYYVKNGKIYLAKSWNSSFDYNKYEWSGDVLIMYDEAAPNGQYQFTRVSE